MQREQFDELLKQAAIACGRSEFVVFGSQAVHAVTANPPAEVIISIECDIWLRDDPETASRLAARVGKDSSFAKATGVFADTLPPDLPMLPTGWEARLVPYTVGGITAHCLDIHDLIVSKLAAGRLKDYEFIAAVVMAKLGRTDELTRRIQTFPDPHTQAVLLARLRIVAEASNMPL